MATPIRMTRESRRPEGLPVPPSQRQGLGRAERPTGLVLHCCCNRGSTRQLRDCLDREDNVLRLRRDGTARPLVRALPIAAVLAALAILPAACGGGAASPGVASLGSTTSTTAPAAGPPTTNGAPDGNSGAGAGSQQSTMSVGGITVDFARCMRTHGIPNFPDPNGQGQVTMNGVDPQSASFEAAQRACAKYSPGGGKSPSPAQQQQMLAGSSSSPSACAATALRISPTRRCLRPPVAGSESASRSAAGRTATSIRETRSFKPPRRPASRS